MKKILFFSVCIFSLSIASLVSAQPIFVVEMAMENTSDTGNITLEGRLVRSEDCGIILDGEDAIDTRNDQLYLLHKEYLIAVFPSQPIGITNFFNFPEIKDWGDIKGKIVYAPDNIKGGIVVVADPVNQIIYNQGKIINGSIKIVYHTGPKEMTVYWKKLEVKWDWEWEDMIDDKEEEDDTLRDSRYEQ